MREGSKGRRRIITLAAITTLALTGAFAASAHALHHQTKIRQIHPSQGGPIMDLGGEWVELQMPAAGENLVNGTTTIRTFQENGDPNSLHVIGTGPPAPGAPNGQNQRTILVSSLFTPAGVTADFVAPVADLQMFGVDGAVCYTENDPPDYTPIDCVSYGSFTGTIPSAGTPAVATPFEQTLERNITRGCATALDSADDTNNSSADFALSTRAPRNNTMAPTETLCTTPGTPVQPNPQQRCKKKKKKKKGKGKSSATTCKKKKKKKKK